MPGELPASSGYTWASELGVDEAVAKVDGRDVVFSQPVYLYLENFAGLPAGEVVPVGYYDAAKSTWRGARNGLVLKLVGVTAGMADLDVTGDGAADTGAALTVLGITDAERQKLAGLYSPGQSLWRTPLEHFSAGAPSRPSSRAPASPPVASPVGSPPPRPRRSPTSTTPSASLP